MTHPHRACLGGLLPERYATIPREGESHEQAKPHRQTIPKGFRRNYRLESVGSAKREVVLRYVARQVERHPMPDPRTAERLVAFQVSRPEVDLSVLRYSAHGQFIYNLHVVLEHEQGWSMTSESFLKRTRRTVLEVCNKKRFQLSEAGIVANHLHLALGAGLEFSPSEVAISMMNNLAYRHGQTPVYRFSYYVGTFGNFDLGAIWHARKAAP